MARRWGARTEYGLDVTLHVYDLSPVNTYVYDIGVGLYHTGVEVNGREYTFSQSGVFYHEPKGATSSDANGTQVKYRESVKLGTYTGGVDGTRKAVDSLRDQFQGNEYHVVLKNCNHFSEKLCAALLSQQQFPRYVNRLAYIGSYLPCFFLEKGQTKNKDHHDLKGNTARKQAFGGVGHALSSPQQRRVNNSANAVSMPISAEQRQAMREARLKKLTTKRESAEGEH